MFVVYIHLLYPFSGDAIESMAIFAGMTSCHHRNTEVVAGDGFIDRKVRHHKVT